MRAYLAILKDSFREATASRILWLVLLLITLVLAVFACLDVVHHASWQFVQTDFPFPGSLVKQLHEGGQSRAASVAKHVWEQIDNRERRQLEELLNPSTADGPPRPGSREQAQQLLAEALTEVLRKPVLYDEQLFREVGVPDDTRRALEDRLGKLSEDELAEHNRRLLEAAFPGLIEPSSGSAYFVKFLRWEFPSPIAKTQDEMERVVDAGLLQVVELFLGVVGVFVAILVTSNMVPRTFEPGSIDLLLSKPIMRPLLYLTKFAGGCAFILLSATFFLVGTWLIAGWRTGVWNHGVLRCIYVFLFLFAIYYSVSALVGVIWRNAILCVAAVVLFWFASVGIGQLDAVIKMFWLQPNRLDAIFTTDGQLWGIAVNGAIRVWDDPGQQWRTILASPDASPMEFISVSQRLAPPVYDPDTERFYALPSDVDVQVPQIAWGTARDEYRFRGAEVPLGRALFRESDGGWLAVSPQGIYRLVGDLTEPPREQRPLRIFGRELPLPIKLPGETRYISVGPEPWQPLAYDFSVDFDPVNNQLVIYSQNSLMLLRRNDQQKYEVIRQTTLPSDGHAAVAIRGGRIVVASDEGVITLLNDKELDVVQAFGTDESDVDRVTASPDGVWFAVEWNDERISLVDADDVQLNAGMLRRQGHLTAATFSDGDQLLVADDRNRVVEYELGEGSRQTVHAPTVSTLERVYYYVIHPLYTVFPKPSELSVWTMYLVTGETTVKAGHPGNEITIDMDMSSAIWSCAIFTIGMLGLGCLFVWRKDF